MPFLSCPLGIGLPTRRGLVWDESSDWVACGAAEVLVDVEGSCLIGDRERGGGFCFVSVFGALLSFRLAEVFVVSLSRSKAVLQKRAKLRSCQPCRQDLGGQNDGAREKTLAKSTSRNHPIKVNQDT